MSDDANTITPTPAAEPFPMPEVGDDKVGSALNGLMNYMRRRSDGFPMATADVAQAAAQVGGYISAFNAHKPKQADLDGYAIAIQAGLDHGYVAFNPSPDGGFIFAMTSKATAMQAEQNAIRDKYVADNPNNPLRHLVHGAY